METPGEGVAKLSADERRAQVVQEFKAFVEHFFNQLGKLPSIERLKLGFSKLSDR